MREGGAGRLGRDEALAALMEWRREAQDFALAAVRAGRWNEDRAVLFVREVANRAAAAWFPGLAALKEGV
jgi:hypothetical protein